jgi:hypothetical protein
MYKLILVPEKKYYLNSSIITHGHDHVSYQIKFFLPHLVPTIPI